MKPRNMYGVGYDPRTVDDFGDEIALLEGIVDVIDPLGLRHVPEKVTGAIKKKVDGYVEEKSQRAAQVMGQRVHAGVKKGIQEGTGQGAVIFAAGALAALALGGGAYAWRRLAADKGRGR